MNQEWAQRFVARWVAQWNDHDLDGLLAHFADDVVFTSPVAATVLGTDGVVRGKEALREYWSAGLRAIPDLRFEVAGHYTGIDHQVIHYRNQKGNLVCEVLRFEDDLVVEGHGTYAAADNPAGVSARPPGPGDQAL
jgi:ketosteroid isomerase-like protein